MEEMQPSVLFYRRIVAGALSGLLGWLLFGIFGNLDAAEDGEPLQQVLAGALLGGAGGYWLAGMAAAGLAAGPQVLVLPALASVQPWAAFKPVPRPMEWAPPGQLLEPGAVAKEVRVAE